MPAVGCNRAANIRRIVGNAMPRWKAAVVAVPLAVCSFVSGYFVPGVAGQEDTPCPSTSSEENVALVRRLYEEGWGQGDIDALDDILGDDYVLHISGLSRVTLPGADATNRGPAAMGETIERFRTGFPDLQVTVDDIVAEGDTVAARTTWSGTQQNSLPAFDAPETGRHMDQETWGFARIECGRIVELWALPDNLTMLRQLGIITDDELTDAGIPTVATPTS